MPLNLIFIFLMLQAYPLKYIFIRRKNPEPEYYNCLCTIDTLPDQTHTIFDFACQFLIDVYCDYEGRLLLLILAYVFMDLLCRSLFAYLQLIRLLTLYVGDLIRFVRQEIIVLLYHRPMVLINQLILQNIFINHYFFFNFFL